MAMVVLVEYLCEVVELFVQHVLARSRAAASGFAPPKPRGPPLASPKQQRKRA